MTECTSKPCHVLMLLSNAFDPDPRVYREAKALVAGGYRVTILCWDRERTRPMQEMRDGIAVERIYVRSTHGRGASQVFFLALFWVRALFRALRLTMHVIHAHDFDTLPLGFLIARYKRVPIVYDAHESYADMLENVPAWMKRLIFVVENVLISRVDALITVGEILEGFFRSRGAQKTCVVGNWKDPEEFAVDEDLLALERARLGIEDGRLVISFIANLGLERQIGPLIEAVKDTPEILLIVGGRGPAAPLVREASETHDNIRYLGFVDPARIPVYTALSHVVFYGFDPRNPNSRFSAPNKLFEAIACGKALISADFGEIGRLIKRYQLGYIVPEYTPEAIRDALKALSVPEVRQKVLQGAQKASQRYTWREASRRLVALYRRITSCREAWG